MKKLWTIILVAAIALSALSSCGYSSRDLDRAFSDGKDDGYEDGYKDGYSDGHDSFMTDVLEDPFELHEFIESFYYQNEARKELGSYFLNDAAGAVEERVGLSIEQAIYTIYSYENDIYPEKANITNDDYRHAVYYLFYFADYFCSKYGDESYLEQAP